MPIWRCLITIRHCKPATLVSYKGNPRESKLHTTAARRAQTEPTFQQLSRYNNDRTRAIAYGAAIHGVPHISLSIADDCLNASRTHIVMRGGLRCEHDYGRRRVRWKPSVNSSWRSAEAVVRVCVRSLSVWPWHRVSDTIGHTPRIPHQSQTCLTRLLLAGQPTILFLFARDLGRCWKRPQQQFTPNRDYGTCKFCFPRVAQFHESSLVYK